VRPTIFRADLDTPDRAGEFRSPDDEFPMVFPSPPPSMRGQWPGKAMTSAGQNLVGLDIGGTKCAVCLPDGPDGIREVAKFPTAGWPETLARLAAIVQDLGLSGPPVLGISAGTLKASEGLIDGAPNLPGWNDVPVVAYFRERLGGEAFLLNDAKAGALAEWRHGAGRGCRHMAFLTAGTGMGAGLILDGRLYLGTGNAGEVGHLRLAPDGPPGHGKFGAFEGFCSGGGIGRWAAEHLRGKGRAGGFDGEPPDRITGESVARAAERGDADAREILAASGQRLGEALAILVDLLGLERIILGSVYVRSRRWLEPAMREALTREALPAPLSACTILPAALGENIGHFAALAAARHGLRSDPSS